MIKIQVGKNGVTPNLIETLRSALKNTKMIRVPVLKGAVRDKEKVKEMADEIVAGLGPNHVYKIIGFVIILRRTKNQTKKVSKK